MYSFAIKALLTRNEYYYPKLLIMKEYFLRKLLLTKDNTEALGTLENNKISSSCYFFHLCFGLASSFSVNCILYIIEFR